MCGPTDRPPQQCRGSPGMPGIIVPPYIVRPVRIYEGALLFVTGIYCNYRDSPYKGDWRGAMTEGPRLSRPIWFARAMGMSVAGCVLSQPLSVIIASAR